MILKSIQLQNFRNYENLSFELDPKINIIYGSNGEGKTNILESIYVLSFTKSFRTHHDQNLINHQKSITKIKGVLQKDIPYNLEVTIKKNQKTVKFDNKTVSVFGSYIEKMNTILFYGEDLNLIKGYPSKRRKYLNLELSQISQTYYNTLNDYNKLLKIRNEYLKKTQTLYNIDNNYFNILTDYIIEKSIFIYQMRMKYIDKINNICPEIFEKITGLKEFKIKYIPSIIEDKMKKETIKKELQKYFSNNLEKELKFKTTLYGPHKDDFEFYLENKNLRYYGSQGQQRLAILTLKLAEIKLLKDYKKENPIILLDDVFSELDSNKKNKIISYIRNDSQVIITTTDIDNIDKDLTKEAKIVHIKQGKLQEEVR